MRLVIIPNKILLYSYFFLTLLTMAFLIFLNTLIFKGDYNSIFKNMNWPGVLNFKTIFLGILIEAMPFIICGVFVSAFLHNFVSEDFISKVLPRKKLPNLLLACLLGILFPVCECGIVPVARRLVIKGVPIYSAATFMLAAPVINPVVAASTTFAFISEPLVVWLRLGLAFLAALAAGWLLSLLFDSRQLKKSVSLQSSCHCGCGHGHSHGHCSQPSFAQKINNTIQTACEEFFAMGKYFILGAFLAAVAQTILTRDILFNIGQNSISSIIAMMAFAFGISVCSSADAFIASSFSGSFTLGSLLAFMVFGPMIDLKNVLMMLNSFRFKYTMALIAIVFFLVAGGAFLINLLFQGV